MKKNKFSSGQIMIFVAGALFCLMLISVSLMSGLYARYISNGEGDDTARVAKFDVATTVPNVDAQFINNTASGNVKTLSVTNNSEVAVRCDLVLTFEVPLPDYISITVGGTTVTGNNTDNVITFENVFSLAPNGDDADTTLTFSMNLDKLTDNATGESVSADLTFNGTLKCVQID